MSKYTIFKTNRFLKDYKKMQKRNNFDEMEFVKVVTMLANGEELPEKYCNHILVPKSERIL
jgi:mRNA-degrading endonuclease YafQ of YafQ-DinJ toxin-antitoxin module